MARRRFQKGHVFRRGKLRKLWVARWREWTVAGTTLKRKQRSHVLGLCSEMNRGDAERRLQDILRPVNDGTYAPAQDMTFGEFSDRWKQDILPTYRASTREFYKATLDRWILRYFRDWRISQITTPEVQRFLNQFSNYSKSVLKHIRATLSVLMATGVAWQYIRQNPVLGIRLPQGKAVRRATVLAPDQLRLVISNLEEPYRTMAALMAGTAIRESELLALMWRDFDTTEHVIHIRRSLYRGKINEGAKTPESDRLIPYGPSIAQMIAALANSPYNRGEYLFLTERGKIYDPTVVERLGFRPLIRRLALPHFTWRSFRRSVATALHDNGTPLRVQQEIMGHANAEMSLLYAQPDMVARRRAIEQLERLVFPNVPNLQSESQDRPLN